MSLDKFIVSLSDLTVEQPAAKFNPNHRPSGPQGGQFTSGPGGDVLLEVAPNPDNKELTARWNSLSDTEKQAITDDIAGEMLPGILDDMGVKGKLVSTAGGFEGEVNPSVAVHVGSTADAFRVAGEAGEIFRQKAMVVMSDSPGEGLEPHGMVSVHVGNGMTQAKLRAVQSKVGDLADGFTYQNGRMNYLNFSGKPDAEYAADIDSALGGSYTVGHTTIYSSYIEGKDYGRYQGNGKGSLGRQGRSDHGAAFDAALEARLKAVGKALESLAKFDPSQPRWPAGTHTGGQWRGDGTTGEDGDIVGDQGSGLYSYDAETRAKLVEPNIGKDLDTLRSEAQVNQDRISAMGKLIEAETGAKFDNTEIKTVASIERKFRQEGYASYAHITDLSRASFEVDSPEQGQKVAEALAKYTKVYDRGWNKLDSNYLDRKLMLSNANGGVSEIQVIPRGVFNYKMHGEGHKLYDISRDTARPWPERQAALSTQQREYLNAVKGTPFEGFPE